MAELELRVREVEGWMQRHDGTCEQRAEDRDKFEKRTDDNIRVLHGRVGKISDRIGRIEVKIAFYAGGCAAAGGILGSLLSKLL